MSFLTRVPYNTGLAVPITRTYNSGSGTDTVPSGAVKVVIEVWGGTASGGGGHTGCGGFGGGGGGSGSYSRSTYNCTGGQTTTYSIGAAGTAPGVGANGNQGGDSTVTAGTLAMSSGTMTGSKGFGGVSGQTTGAGGGGGTAPGGGKDTTSNGNTGSNQNTGNGGAGAPGVAGVHGTGPTGGAGGSSGSPGLAGSTGQVIYYYT